MICRYIGFDAVTTAALESRNPRRDLPIGIIGSLVISTVLYIATCTVMTGAANYTELGVSTPITVAVDAVQKRTGKSWRWLNIIVTLVRSLRLLLLDIRLMLHPRELKGALCGLTSVLLINLLAQSRVFYSMARDGLLPSWMGKVHPRFKTPYVATIICGTVTAILAAVLPVDLLGNMTSVGTLLAFFVVHFGVIVLRFTRPEVDRRFKIPGGKYFFAVFPILGMTISVLLIAVAEVTTIWVCLSPEPWHAYLLVCISFSFFSVCLYGWALVGSFTFPTASAIPPCTVTLSADSNKPMLVRSSRIRIKAPRKPNMPNTNMGDDLRWKKEKKKI